MPRGVTRAYHALAAAAISVGLGSAVHDVETHRLDNGLALYIAPGHAAPVAAIQAWVGVGSADEVGPQAGVAHVVEHMLFKGGNRGTGELAREITGAGGEINAWTSFDHTVYHATIGRDHAEHAIAALGAALTQPRVDPIELAREREVILEEIRQGADDPARAVAQSLFAAAYAQHPYRRPVIGTADSVRKLGERDLVEFFRSHYVADNMAIVVAGDVDPARVRREVERCFGDVPAGRTRRRPAAEPAQTAPRAVATLRDVAEAYVAVGFHVPAARHADLAALDVAAILLGDSESARLPCRLRDRDEIVTSAYAQVHALRDPGLFVLSATARPRDAKKTVGGLVDQALALASDLSPDELEKARIAAEAGLVRQLETAQGRARTVGWNATMTGDPRFAHLYLDRVRAVRRHDVAQAVRRYLRPENATVAAVLPAPRKAAASRARAKPADAFARHAEAKVRTALAGAPAQPAIVEQRVVLPNGMVVIVRRDPSVPVVAMRAVWRGGQRAERDDEAGASTILARLITRGCGALDAAQVADQIDRLGGALGGVSGRSSFGLAAEWLARSWAPGLELVADCVLDPQLPAAELAREKRQVLDDQVAQRDNPTQVAFRLFMSALYGAHPYHRDVLGTPASIDALTRDQLAAFYRERYPLSQLVLTIVGDVDVDDALARVEQRFGAVPTGGASKNMAKAGAWPPASPIAGLADRPAEDREVYQYLDRAQAHLVIGFPGATVDAPDRFALELLVAVLGGQSGRLFAELRDRQALVYRVSAHSVEGLDPGFVAVYLSCAPEKLEAAAAAAGAELDRVRTSGVTADELERAKRYVIGSHQIAMQRRAAVANAIAYHEAYGLGWRTWAAYDDAIRAVTVADVAAAADKYLASARAITATVRPPAATPAAAKRLTIKQPARVPDKSSSAPAKKPAKAPAKASK